MENSGEPDFTHGTLEGDIASGKITFFCLQGSAEGKLSEYIVQGEVLEVATRSFDGIGIIVIPEMGRFYRHVLIEKHYPTTAPWRLPMREPLVHGASYAGHHGYFL